MKISMRFNVMQGRIMEVGVRNILEELAAVFFAVCSVVALFADVESTGNLSMALNGDGIAQLIALVFLEILYRRIIVKKECLNGLKKRDSIGYAMLAFLFAVFMLIGREQSADEELKYGYIAVVMLIGYVPLFFIMLSFIGMALDRVRQRENERPCSRLTKWLFEEHVILGVMIAVFLCRLPYLIAFYPCSMTWDGGAQISSFYGIEPFTDHHPPLLSFVYGAIAMYSQKWGIPNMGMFVIPIANTLLSAFAAAKVCEFFKYIKAPYWVRWASLIYYAAFTVWCIFDVTVIKDTLYYPLVTLFALQTVYAVMPISKRTPASEFVRLVIYGILVTQIRNNGIFVLIFTLPAAFIIINRKKKAAFAFASAIMLIAVFAVNNLLYPALGVTKIKVKEDTYCIMFQQTAKYGRDYPEDVTDEERQFLNTMFDYDELVEVYNPRLADWVKNCLKICEATSADHTNSEFAAIRDKYFRIWFAQFLRHPMSYVDTFLECSYGYYYPEVKPYKEGNGFYEEERYTFTESMHSSKQIEQLAPARFILEQAGKLEYLPGIGLLYRCGFYTWCVAYAVAYLIIKKRGKELIAAVPALVNILVCLISPVNTCIRYAMPTMCFVPVLLAVLCSRGIFKSTEEGI